MAAIPDMPQANHWTSRFNGLRGRMSLLLLVTLLLPTAYAVGLAIDQYRSQGQQQLLELQRTARLVADHRARTLNDIQTWLESSARVQAFPAGAPGCRQALEDRLLEMRRLSRLFLASRDGRIICDADGEQAGVDVGGSFWFQRAIRGSVFTVSELTTDADGDDTLILAVPMYVGETWRTEPWAPQGALAATLDLEAFAASEREVGLAAGLRIYLIDRLGKPVPPLPWLDEDEEAPDIAALLAGDRKSLRVASGSRNSALLATANIGFTGLKVVVAKPIGSTEWLRPEVLVPILLPALILVVGVVAIFTGTHLVVNRHVERLAEAVRRHRPGGDGIAEATVNAPNELEELGQRFARLAQELEEREESLRRAVAQKDLLLREITHRVKNNLQVVASLLRMRARSGQTVESRAAIRDAHARIEAIALVHRRIYEQGAVENVELSAFVGELLDHLRKSIGREGVTIEAVGDISNLSLATDRTVSMALLITELVTNALEHAFPDGRQGHIRIGMQADEDGVAISVADDGVGFDHAAPRDGTGINLAELLARQLGGELVFVEVEEGTRVELRLPSDEVALTSD